VSLQADVYRGEAVRWKVGNNTNLKLQFDSTPAPVVIESAGNTVQLTWEEQQRVYAHCAHRCGGNAAKGITTTAVVATVKVVYEYFESDHVFANDKATGKHLVNAELVRDGKDRLLTGFINKDLNAVGASALL
jgi:hypothetical protein